MKKYISMKENLTEEKFDLSQYTNKNTIVVTMYLKPYIYSDFEEVVGSVSYDKKKRKYHTDVNPARIINGPLSEYGQDLQNPVKDEYDGFLEDCVWLIKEVGFTIIQQSRSTDSKKSEYIMLFGMEDDPFGTLVFDLRISDHPFDAEFPEDWKEIALNYLKMENVLDRTAEKAGIDFTVEQVLVGSVKNDTWDRALDRLYNRLLRMKKYVRIRNRREK